MIAALGALALCYAALLAYLWHMLRAYPLHRRVLDLLYPVSQVAMVLCAGVACILSGKGALYAQIAIGAGAACMLCDLALFRAIAAAEERDAQAWRSRMLEEQLRAQRFRYEQAAHLAHEADEIERDANSRLRSIAGAIDAGDIEDACALIAQAIDAVPSRGSSYCRNRAVDALLAYKGAQCEREGIELRAMVQVPEELALSGAEVCAVFANLLDNAMHACAGLGSARRRIDLVARVAQGMLSVTVENPCEAGERRRFVPRALGERAQEMLRPGVESLPEHGWGVSIVAEICQRHEGRLFVEQRDGLHRASAVLRAAAVPEGERPA